MRKTPLTALTLAILIALLAEIAHNAYHPEDAVFHPHIEHSAQVLIVPNGSAQTANATPGNGATNTPG